MIDSQQLMMRAEELLHRMSPEGRERARRIRARRAARAKRIVKRLFVGLMIVLGATIALAATIGPIGASGVMLVVLALVLVTGGVLLWSGDGTVVEPAQLREVDLARLPAQTERWLETQRPALPPPAQRLTDQIGIRLETLMPQLQGLDAREPAAHEVRRLIADELPELVRGYQRVPKSMRRATADGTSPDRQLIEGLALVDSELKRMCELLAAGDLDKLATQGRYLQLKYRGDPLDG